MAKVVSITEAASIGLHGMILIAESDELVNVQVIAEKTGASRHHVAKVFQRLVKQGWLRSHRGPTGGFTLKIDPGEVTFLQIYEAIEGEIEIQECPLDHQICAFDKCILNNVTSKMARDFKNYLEKQVLADYVRK